MPEVMTNDVINAMYCEDDALLASYSPYAACLLPLLTNMDQRLSLRDIAAALPYYSFDFNLAALRSILSRLGYDSTQVSTKLTDLESDQFPCLIIQGEKPTVVYESFDNEFAYFDASQGVTSIGELTDQGLIYLISHRNPDVIQSKVQESWFQKLLFRFKTLRTSLLLITSILNLTGLLLPLFIMAVYDIVIAKNDGLALPTLIAGVLIVVILDLVLRIRRSKLLAGPAGRLEYLLACESLKKLLSLPTAMTERSSVPAQISKLRLYDNIRECCTGATALLILELPFIFVFVIAIAIIGGNLVYIPLAAIVAMALMGIILLPRFKRALSEAAEAKTQRERYWLETLSGALEVKSMARVEQWLKKIHTSTVETCDIWLVAAKQRALATALANAIAMLAATAVIGFGGLRAIEGSLSVGALIALMAFLWKVVNPLQSLFLAFAQFDQLLQGWRGFDELMTLKSERAASSSSLMVDSIEGDIKLERVSFRYSPHNDPVLVGINFHIPVNQCAVIVGGNGSGKSTLLKLLCGLYRPQLGNIYLSGTDIRQFNVSELRNVMGYVPQHPTLFHGDIAANLRLGNMLATDEELKQAAKIAGVLNAIEKLPKGFATRIGDQATQTMPSGLQRGICLARALVRHPPVLLLDEPGAGQDRRGLHHLAHHLRQQKGTKTIVMVTHLPELIALADQVIVIRHGYVEDITSAKDYLTRIDQIAV